VTINATTGNATTGNAILGGTSKASIQSAIAFASQKTGIDFSYLLGQAQVESGLRADARAATSSATGLYQFIDQSWLAVVKKHGAEHGLGWAANSITSDGSGRYTVNDAGTRQAILALRRDPQTASLLAAEHAADNKAALEGTLGRPATGTDLYLAHFLGLGGAKTFLRTLASNPSASGAALFPQAAQANRSIFYGAGGQPRSLSEIYSRFAAKLDRGAAAGGAAAPIPSPLDALSTLGDGEDGADANDVTVIPGAGESSATASAWAQSLIAQTGNRQDGAANPFRPTPATARLAYLMLASLGG